MFDNLQSKFTQSGMHFPLSGLSDESTMRCIAPESHPNQNFVLFSTSNCRVGSIEIIITALIEKLCDFVIVTHNN